jgi:hypothetical protein
LAAPFFAEAFAALREALALAVAAFFAIFPDCRLLNRARSANSDANRKQVNEFSSPLDNKSLRTGLRRGELQRFRLWSKRRSAEVQDRLKQYRLPPRPHSAGDSA